MSDLISRQAAIDALDVDAELLRRVLDNADIVGVEREKYEWGLGLIESHISDMKDLPSAEKCIEERQCACCSVYGKLLHQMMKTNNQIHEAQKKAFLKMEERITELERESKHHDMPSVQPKITPIAEIKIDKKDLEEILRNPIMAMKWIPCSERLPEPPSFCLVTTDGSHNDIIDIALYMSDGWHKASEVIAWMPLPKPYKDGEKT